MSEIPKASTTVTYIGRRRTVNGRKVAYAYLGEPGDMKLYPKPLVVGAPVGAVIVIQHPDDDNTNRYFSSGPHAPTITAYVKDDRILAWQVADRAAYEQKAQEDAILRAARNADALESHLTALEEAAARLSNMDRVAFARYVENRLRGVR